MGLNDIKAILLIDSNILQVSSSLRQKNLFLDRLWWALSPHYLRQQCVMACKGQHITHTLHSSGNISRHIGKQVYNWVWSGIEVQLVNLKGIFIYLFLARYLLEYIPVCVSPGELLHCISNSVCKTDVLFLVWWWYCTGWLQHHHHHQIARTRDQQGYQPITYW